ncbi:hypothetical protein QYE76_007537 [Lolium multiflorum]|uniref:Uncharacterized protein n=1 Tax=Lolium multiflorum TaxID=4521 RepID=A0AAD8QHR1_LOLMU|nr:hypothetical protein QYE76_007537 [Lolium multiflorum]
MGRRVGPIPKTDGCDVRDDPKPGPNLGLVCVAADTIVETPTSKSEDAVADAVVLSPSRDLPPSAASPLPPEVSSHAPCFQAANHGQGQRVHPARAWSVQTLWEVMTACVMMHNVIVEVERNDSLFDNEWDGLRELVTPQGGPTSFQDILHVHHEIWDQAVHNQLPADLVEHMWAHVGNNAANNYNEENPEENNV